MKIIREFLNSEESFAVRIFQVISFGGVLAAIAGCITNAISGLPFGVTLGTLFGGLAVFLLAVFVTKTKKTEVGGCLLVIFFNCFLLPMMFFTSGGVNSGISAWFVLGIFVVFLLVKGKLFWTMLALCVSSMIITYLAAYYNPEKVIPLADEFTSYEDIIFSILIVTIIIGLIVRFQNRVYREEQEKVIRQNKELEHLSNARNKFFTNMSHEIRTPINTIIGLNEMILREDISDEIAENAIHIQDASKMLLALINDILDMSKIESGKMEIVPIQYET